MVLVICCGGFIVSRFHEISGREEPTGYGGPAADTKPVNATQVVYEISGPVGTVADISYFDANTEPRQVNGASLPWSLTMTVTSPAVVANVVAQGDSDSIGCRILVDGEVKAERTSNEVNAYTFCMVKS
jgi:hypothetical protein